MTNDSTADATPTEQAPETETVATVQDDTAAPVEEQSSNESTDADDNTESTEDDTPGLDRAKNDAKKYRHRLRETENDLATARDTIAGMKGAILSGHIASAALDGSAVIRNGKPVKQPNLAKLLKAEGYSTDALVNDDGTVDTAALKTACDHINEEYGTDFAKVIIPGPGKRDYARGRAATWSDVLRNE